MSKRNDKKSGGGKPPKSPKAPKRPKAAKPSNKDEDIEDATIEELPEGDEYPEGEDFDVEVEIEVDVDDNSSDRDAPFGKDGFFGQDGPFGPKGPFGPDGPFGPGGFFGPQGPFGQGGKRRHRHRHHVGPRGARRRGRMFGPGELRLVLLALIAEEPRHGYDCIKALEEATDGAYAPSPGVIYPTLQLLLDEGLIVEQESEDSRKVYEATEAGQKVLEESQDEIEELLERLGRRARRASAAKSSDMMRAMGNLASVLANSAAQGKLSGDNKHKVVDLIDELARKIERL